MPGVRKISSRDAMTPPSGGCPAAMLPLFAGILTAGTVGPVATDVPPDGRAAARAAEELGAETPPMPLPKSWAATGNGAGSERKREWELLAPMKSSAASMNVFLTTTPPEGSERPPIAEVSMLSSVRYSGGCDMRS
mmetsp:Transcript_79072/g.199587  ORF Transcript_79072/g.199587 Transcript_79072/m.199587 type:complete len:136 (+) Transcript_79072:1208-1615(+)